jgi:hypothetical protein
MTTEDALLNMAHPVRKPIVPHSAFVNGRKVMASAINVVSVADNLFDHVVFKYTLYDADCHWAGEGAYELKGEAYAAWDASAADAFQAVADGIGVEFVPSGCGTFFGTGEAE